MNDMTERQLADAWAPDARTLRDRVEAWLGDHVAYCGTGDDGDDAWLVVYTMLLHADDGGPGIPYAAAGVRDGIATATCPVCGAVSTGVDAKAAARAYAAHFEREGQRDADGIGSSYGPEVAVGPFAPDGSAAEPGRLRVEVRGDDPRGEEVGSFDELLEAFRRLAPAAVFA